MKFFEEPYRLFFPLGVLMGLTALTAFGGSLVVDPFAVFFFYLFLAAAAISILMSVKYM